MKDLIKKYLQEQVIDKVGETRPYIDPDFIDVYADDIEKLVKNNAVLQHVSGTACRELVECADCENRHFKDERVEKKEGAWMTHRCPKCGSESYCRI